jgi:hypothetical protein
MYLSGGYGARQTAFFVLMKLKKSQPPQKKVAEKEGFEPPVGCPTLVFKTSAFSQALPFLRPSRIG